MQPLSDLRTRTREDVLAYAYDRGTRLRRQRHAVRSAAVAVAIFAVAAPVLTVLSDSSVHTPERVRAGDTPTTTAPSPAPPTPADDVGSPGSEPAGGAVPPSQGAVPARPARQPVAAYSPPQATAVCGRDDVEVAVAPDRPQYARTDTVRMTARIRNTSNRPCVAPSTVSIVVTDQIARTVHTSTLPLSLDGAWQAGQTLESAFTWQPCSSATCDAAGFYQVDAVWRGPRDYGPARNTFTIFA